jgi:N-acetylglucosaminyl-diphospho-decaprenol L-rhamnosyltransferase
MPAPVDQPLVTAVVVTYNSQASIDAALDALAGARQAPGLECVVVDNASQDATVARVRERHPWVRVIESGHNLGFGRGCNLGARSTRARYLLFVNPDTRVGPSAVARLQAFMEEHPRAGICAPALREGEHAFQQAGLLPSPGSVLRAAAGLGPPHPDARAIVPGAPPFRTRWVCGAVLMIRSDLFAQLSGFDPRFFLYFEETDLCLRAARRGAEIWAVGEAVADHEASLSARASGSSLVAGGCIAEHYFPSRFYFFVKHHGRLPALAVEAAEPLLLLLRAGWRRLLGRAPDALLRERLSAPLFRLPRRVA